MIVDASWYGWGGPLPAPTTVRISGEACGERRGVLLRVRDDAGRDGFGEATPFLASECADLAAAFAALDWQCLPLPGRPDELTAPPELPPAARFALETAVGQLACARAGVSFATWLGGRRLRPLHRCVYVGCAEDDGIEVRASSALARGARHLKLKMRGARGLDVAERISRLLGDTARLRLDFNGSLEGTDVPAVFRALRRFSRVELVEEPCSGAALAGLAPQPIPVFADESAAALCATGALRSSRGIAGVVLKPTREGGIAGALALRALALAAGKGALLTHAFEGPVALAALCELALALGPADLAPGLDLHGALAAFVPDAALPQLSPRDAFVRPSPIGVTGLLTPSTEKLRMLGSWTR